MMCQRRVMLAHALVDLDRAGNTCGQLQGSGRQVLPYRPYQQANAIRWAGRQHDFEGIRLRK
jgi:hypothetical protein